MSLMKVVSSSVQTSNPMISHSLLGLAKCWVITKICSVVLVALLNTNWVVFVVDGSPSHVRPYDDVNATKNELVTTPATFKNSKMLYHMPEMQITRAELSRDSCKWQQFISRYFQNADINESKRTETALCCAIHNSRKKIFLELLIAQHSYMFFFLVTSVERQGTLSRRANKK